MADICIFTPAPGYTERTDGPAADYRRLFGDRLALCPWTEAGDLSRFALVLPLLAWGYHQRAAEWFAALEAWNGVRFANPTAMLRWNSDKHYLLELEAAGVAIVPTIATAALSAQDLAAARAQFAAEQLIVKPAISGGAERTYRLGADAAIPADALGTSMLIQPLMRAIAAEGEFSLFYFDGLFSHAVVKRPAAGDFRVQNQFGGYEEAVVPETAATSVAERAFAACSETPLYARVDLVRGPDDAFNLMELELIEPALFFEHTADRGAMFAEAVTRRLSRS